LFRTFAFAAASGVVNAALGVVQCARYDAFCPRGNGRPIAGCRGNCRWTSTVDPKYAAINRRHPRC
jgi:hypothetical protein